MRTVLPILEKRYGVPRRMARFDPMEELVSCILSQHTTDAASFPAFARLMAHFGTWEAIAEAPVEEVANVIRRAGLANQKARSIQGALRAIRARNGDYHLEPLRDMPLAQARVWLEELQGVGPKTASIVLCFSFGKGAIPVDTHVFRVAKRIGILDASATEAKAHDLLLKIVPAEMAFAFHVLLIQHGRVVCRAPNPRCDECPITEYCRWYRSLRGKENAVRGRKGAPRAAKSGKHGGR